MNGENCFGQAPFIRIPPALFESGLNAAAIAVWGALARWVTDSDGHCWRTIADLAQDTKLSEATVQRAIRTLKKKGWVKVTLHHGAHSTYRLIWNGSPAISMQPTEESDITQTSLLAVGSDVVPMQHTEESDITQTSLLNVKPAQQREKDGKWHHTDVTLSKSDITQTSLQNAKPAQQNVSGQAPLYRVVLSKKRTNKERESEPSFSSEEQQKKEQANQEPKQTARHVSTDEQYQLEQAVLNEQKKPDLPSFDWVCSYVDHWNTGSEPKAWLRRRHPDRNVDNIIEQTEIQLQANGAPPIKCGLSFLDYCCEYPFEKVGTGWETTAEFINQLWRHVHQAKRHVRKAGGNT